MQPEKEAERRERERSLLLFTNMIREEQIEKIQQLLQPLLTDDIFLVDLRIKPTNNIKIFLDADSGLGIEKCIRINRALYKVIEEQAIYPDGDFSLEVSSPGVDEPLKIHRQYLKNVGREVEITLNDATVKTGTLESVNEIGIHIKYTEGKNKKAVTHEIDIPFADISKTKVLIKF